MPFINNSPQTENLSFKNILYLSVDHSDIHSQTVEIAKNYLTQNLNPLWIDGNLGFSDNDKIYTPLDKMLNDKAAISKAIRKINHLSILSGKATHPLVTLPLNFQQQFISDLSLLSGNFDKMFVSLSSSDTQLQELWLSWADKTYLFFKTENLFLEKTAQFLSDYVSQIDALISLNPNPHTSRLAWLRLKKMIPDLPELILDITKAAQ